MTARPRRSDAHPVLDGVERVVSQARHVTLHEARIEDVAGWLSCETLAWPDFRSPFLPEADDAGTMDFIFLTAATNFAFTDFETHRAFTTTWSGRTWSDSDAMMACLKRALREGKPVLDGAYLAALTRSELDAIFKGGVPIPMLAERLEIYREIGRELVERHGGRFHRFLRVAPRSVPALLEVLVEAFPSFRDETLYRGERVVFAKRAQLLLWQLHARFRSTGLFALDDPGELTAFADYIVPVALDVLGITSYSEALERSIAERRVLPRDSEEEVEIRAAAVWGCHLLTRAVNRLRPDDRQVVDAVLDARLWTHYHETHRPHHLTVTTAY